MRKIQFVEALAEAMAEEMRVNDKIFVMGEDVGLAGGVRMATKGLWEEFGEERVRDTPISEAVIVGAGVGAAITGTIPIVELMYGDFLFIAGDEIFNKMAKWRYEHGGTMKIPMVLRISTGGGFGGAAEHSQSLEMMLMSIPGIDVYYPSTPAEAKAMLKYAIRDENPSVFLEHRLLYKVKGEVSDVDLDIPFGKADIKRVGKDITVVVHGYQVMAALSAAEKLQAEGIDVEVVDLRFISPLDKETILKSVAKTGRLVTMEEGHKTGGVGGEVSAIVAEEGIFNLFGPIKRVAALDLPIPYSKPMEKFVLPSEEKLIDAIREVMRY